MSKCTARSFLLSLSLLAACGGDREPERTWLDDWFPAGLELSPEVGAGLHSPYVVGTEVQLFVQTMGPDLTPTRRLDVTSDDPDVVRIDLVDEDGGVSATAVGVGTTTLRVVDVATGEELASDTVEVRAPTRIEIYPDAALGRDGARADAMREDATLHVLASQGALYFVRYFDGETELAGSEVLEIAPETSGEGEEMPSAQTLGAPSHREWLFVRAADAGSSADLTLRAAGRELGALRIESVAPEAIATIELQDEEAGAADGDRVAVLGLARDAEGQAIGGVSFAFELDGAVVEGEGDLFAYRLDRDAPRELRASVPGSGAEARMTVHVGAGSERVTTTIAPQCGVAHGARGGTLVALAMLALGLVLARRRSQ